MPQMSPILWTAMYMFTMSMFLYTMIILNSMPPNKIKNNKDPQMYKIKIWKW